MHSYIHHFSGIPAFCTSSTFVSPSPPAFSSHKTPPITSLFSIAASIHITTVFTTPFHLLLIKKFPPHFSRDHPVPPESPTSALLSLFKPTGPLPPVSSTSWLLRSLPFTENNLLPFSQLTNYCPIYRHHLSSIPSTMRLVIPSLLFAYPSPPLPPLPCSIFLFIPCSHLVAGFFIHARIWQLVSLSMFALGG